MMGMLGARMAIREAISGTEATRACTEGRYRIIAKRGCTGEHLIKASKEARRRGSFDQLLTRAARRHTKAAAFIFYDENCNTDGVLEVAANQCRCFPSGDPYSFREFMEELRAICRWSRI